MLNMVLQLDNDCEGLFYIILKYRRDKDIIYTLYVFISIYFFYALNKEKVYLQVFSISEICILYNDNIH